MQNLKKNLENKLKGAQRVAILGVGSEIMSDDAVGINIASALEKWLDGENLTEKAKVFLGHSAPENLTGEIKKFKPTHLLIIDCAHFGRNAGEIALFDPQDISGVTFSTHRLPLHLITDYLALTTKCDTTIVAIQPKNIKFSEVISDEVKKTSKAVSSLIKDVLSKI